MGFRLPLSISIDAMKKKITIWVVVAAMSLCLIGTIGAGLYVRHRINSYSKSKAVEYLTAHASSKSKGACAMYVRRALIAGGMPAYVPVPACRYDAVLPCYGFERIARSEARCKGDIVVFPARKGHPYGHIAMWNGERWVSDFRQSGFYVNAVYKGSNYRFWRFKGLHNSMQVVRAMTESFRGL
jgi:hypothetical protein